MNSSMNTSRENRVAVVTGANSGIGFETSLALVEKGFELVMVCRNEQKAQMAQERLLERFEEAKISYIVCDFIDPEQIRSAAEQIRSRYSSLQLLVNNHGYLAAKEERDARNIESTIAVNHLGYFLFTYELREVLLASNKDDSETRVVNVASEAHRGASLDVSDFALSKKYSNWKAYSNSKLFNILFTRSLANRWREKKVGVFSVHPGVIRSNFGQSSTWLVKAFWKLGALFMKSNREGAQSSLYAALSPDLKNHSGAYIKDEKIAQPTRLASNDKIAEKLWLWSEEVCEIKW